MPLTGEVSNSSNFIWKISRDMDKVSIPYDGTLARRQLFDGQECPSYRLFLAWIVST